MTEAITVFTAEFIFIFLLGIQTQNVVGKQYIGAMATSLAIGTLGLYLTSIIARHAVLGGNWFTIAMYLVAGPLGIAFSMWMHSRIMQALKREPSRMDAMSENIAWGRERDEAFAKEQAAIAAERELPSYREAEQAMPRCNECRKPIWTPQEAPKPIDANE